MKQGRGGKNINGLLPWGDFTAASGLTARNFTEKHAKAFIRSQR